MSHDSIAFAGEDPGALRRSALSLAVLRGAPTAVSEVLGSSEATPPDWRARFERGGRTFKLLYGDTSVIAVIATSDDTVKVIGGLGLRGALEIAAFVAPVELDFATVAVSDEVRRIYRGPVIGAGLFDLGWALVFRGARGHARWLRERGWLAAGAARGAWALHEAVNDVSIVTFTDRARPIEQQAKDVERGHAAFRAGFVSANEEA